MPLGVFADSQLAGLSGSVGTDGIDVLPGVPLASYHGPPLTLQVSETTASLGKCRIHQHSSGNLHPTCFVDLQYDRKRPGSLDPEPGSDEWFVDLDDRDKPWLANQEAERPWLGIVETPQVLYSTTLLNKEWIAQPINKKVQPWVCPKHPAESDHRAWWHPEFVFTAPYHAVRIRLKQLYPTERMMWDVIFAGRPGNPWTIPPDATPAGGKLPVFEMFCPPSSANTKLELRLTDAENETFDETLTLMPKAVAASARLKWKRNNEKPRLQQYTQRWQEGAIRDDEPLLSLGEGLTDEFGNIQYMSMPPAFIALASFL